MFSRCIGKLNYRGSIHCLIKILDIVREMQLQTITYIQCYGSSAVLLCYNLEKFNEKILVSILLKWLFRIGSCFETIDYWECLMMTWYKYSDLRICCQISPKHREFSRGIRGASCFGLENGNSISGFKHIKSRFRTTCTVANTARPGCVRLHCVATEFELGNKVGRSYKSTETSWDNWKNQK